MARPITPPPRKPVLELQTPNHRDAFYTELVNRDDLAYKKEHPIKRGTPYQNITGAKQQVIDDYPNLFFLKEIKPGNSGDVGNTDQWVIWVWATDELAESVYNAEIGMMEESTSHPRYVRDYTIRRKDYETTPTIAPGTPLTGMISVAITAGGTGYTNASGTIAGGATVEFVCFEGAIIYGIVTKEGASVTSGGAITITGDGTGATATARIQPASAVLVAQTKLELPKDDPRSHEYVLVRRVYETLPGPTISNIRIDPEMNVAITTTKRKRVASDISPGSAIVGSSLVVTDREDIDAYIAYEVITTIPQPAAGSEGTALEGTRAMGFQFPGRINIMQLDLYGTAIGHQAPNARLIEATVKTWWVISASKPTLSFAVILPKTISINNVVYRDVLHDSTTRDYNGSAVLVLGTTPTASQYAASWVGTSRLVDGDVTATRYHKLWKVEALYVTMR